MHPQMNLLHPQNIAFQQQQQQQLQQQQQWDRLRRQQVSTRGSVMIIDKDRPMKDVKIENIMEGPIDTNSFNALKKQQMQLRQQQMAMAKHPTQFGQHFKQLQSIQIPQLQAQLAQNTFNMRNVPVKVEAFQELMSGDSTLKHEPSPNKLNPQRT
ncbi:zinc finger protein 853-like isoform X1 [Phalaenopsis equestris]|uniref:zinc finger protein 853-like isoform X1 n=1 Tax=Phalaenopsis equestris TaxID=78828 RepID=UPI0009E227BE|nr:zinc finger protein 853-like isoform X1 [Phalaenopsis equestris]